jgi:hypothetical protein
VLSESEAEQLEPEELDDWANDVAENLTEFQELEKKWKAADKSKGKQEESIAKILWDLSGVSSTCARLSQSYASCKRNLSLGLTKSQT